MFQSFLMLSVNTLFSLLTPDKVENFIRTGIEKLEKFVLETENEMDDKIVIPSANLVLAALNIPGKNGAIDINGELRKLFDALGDLSKVFIDGGLDYVEDLVVASSNKIDDEIVLPMCKLIRKVLDIPDDDQN